MRFEGQEPGDKAYAMGTGWLISPDTLITAGHNVYDWSGYGRGLGRAVHIKCYIGYHGKKNVDSPIVQQRLAKSIVTTAEWLTSRENRHRDVAIIQLDRPFTGELRLFTYKPTPKQADEMIGVVGYPADKVLADEDGPEERGAQMYEEFGGVAYSLEKNKQNPLGMLKYRISTFGGQSGAPVLRKGSKLVAIGTHVYGGGDKNQAGAIGTYGNDYDALLKVLTQQLPTAGEYQGIKLVKHEGAASNAPAPQPQTANGFVPQPSAGFGLGFEKTGLNQNPFIQTSSSQNGFNNSGFNPVESSPVDSDHSFEQGDFVPFVSTEHDEDVEIFLEVFRAVGRLVSGSLSTISPLLGPIGGPISAVAGATLNTIANAAESAFDSSMSRPSSLGSGSSNTGVTERAILAEASLQAVFKMPSDDPITHRVLNDMKVSYMALAPNIQDLIPKIAPALIASAKKITSDGRYIDKNNRRRRTLPAQPLQGVSNAEASFSGNDFLNGLLAPTKPLEGEAELFGLLGPIINTGFNLAKPLLREGAEHGLSFVGGLLSAADPVGESSFAEEQIRATELVSKRAFMGEAALQALSKLSMRELDQLQLVPADPYNESSADEGNIFDFVKTAAQTIGGLVQETVPTVLKAITPIFVDAVFSKKAANGPAERFLTVTPPPRNLKKRASTSILDELTRRHAASPPGIAKH
ncbi:hypothetical protein B0T24DRAFT_657798 [Lasiosphaeria ovina]|uniref:Serine protease n=1 Tax=Lasiosphaeria ovina TaxID=92902 RepID=A0AAE0N8R7_9PEZI|nr:hypothetical protein B0T24DRAFT_657798 [Lasiosphaeria ovina]